MGLADLAEEMERANGKAIEIMNRGKALLVDFGSAKKLIPGMKDDVILHAGPPITYERMIEPMRAAVQGGLIFEGRAADEGAADSLARREDVEFKPCHEMQSVAPMAGVITSNMFVAVVHNPVYGNKTFCNLHEGRGKILRFGATGKEVIDRLRWMNDVLGPALREAVSRNPVDLKGIATEGVLMGDELHQRFKASSLLFLTRIAEQLQGLEKGKEAYRFIAEREQFFLNLSMPAMKALADPADGIECSTIVTRMTRNGVGFGIQVSGLKGRWFIGEAEVPRGLYFAGFSQDDASRDFGDSAIMETMGLGGMSSAAAPSVTRFVGGNATGAVRITEDSYKITWGTSRDFLIPYLEFKGAPLGIDVVKVNQTGILPSINTGIAHRKAGIGQIGAGVSRPPRSAFQDALREYARHYGV